jgi:hypothetical protein
MAKIPAEKKYEVWKIKSYGLCTQQFIENNGIEYNLNQLLNELGKDEGYHLRVGTDRSYIFFGDCDKFRGTFNEFSELLIRFLSKYYSVKITKEQISYTKNEKVAGSFHYSIPNLYASCKKQKEIHENFFKKHKDIFEYKVYVGAQQKEKNQIVVDHGIYRKQFFRYPNQTKETTPNTKHIIQRGKLIDFVIEYIPDDSICIDNRKYRENFPRVENICDLTMPLFDKLDTKESKNSDRKDKNSATKKKRRTSCIDNNDSDNDHEHEENSVFMFKRSLFHNNTKDNIEESEDKNSDELSKYASTSKRYLIIQLLPFLNMYNDYHGWTKVGMALKNESSDKEEFFELWHKWSQQSKTKYKGYHDCKTKWDSFKYLTKGRRYLLCSLIEVLKTNDPVGFNKINAMRNSYKVMYDNRDDYYNENECNVIRIVHSNGKYIVVLSDKYCPNHKGIHMDANNKYDTESYRAIEITPRGLAGMICTHKDCANLHHPRSGILLPASIVNNIFVNNNNNFAININYGTNKWLYSIKIYLCEQSSIYDDQKLNEMMINSFSGNSTVADVISYVYKDKLLFIDNEWYIFNSRWTKCVNITNEVFCKFSKLYDRIQKFIEESSELTVEKLEYKDQIIQLRDKLISEKKNKEICNQLQTNMSKQNTFDTDMKLLGFKNGVYDFEKMIFRQYEPTDMVLKTTGYDYSEVYENKKDLMYVLSNIFPSIEIMECCLQLLVLSLCRKNVSNLLLFLKWSEKSKYSQQLLVETLIEMLGEYCCIKSKSEYITFTKTQIDSESYFKSIRLMFIESTEYISESEEYQFLMSKMIKFNNNKIKIAFTSICMCTTEPNVKESIENKVGYITMSEKLDINEIISSNDLFLLLLEYLKKYNHNNIDVIFSKIKYVKPDNRTIEEKICDEFIKEHIEKGNANDKCKARNIVAAYKKWLLEKKYAIKPTKIDLFDRLKLNYEFRNSMRFNDKWTTGFYGLILK